MSPVFISQHDLLDVAEGEFERDRPDPQRSSGLPPPSQAGSGQLDVPRMPPELEGLIGLLGKWRDAARELAPEPRPIGAAVLGGRFAQAAYRMQLLPLLGDPQAQTLKGQTGELARSGWQAVLDTAVIPQDDPHVLAMSEGHLTLLPVSQENPDHEQP